MKTQLVFLSIFFTFLSSLESSAQYNYGLDRSIGAENRYNTPKKKKAYDFVKVSTENMVKELNLDGFQEAIIKTIFEDYKNAVTNINEEEIPEQAKYEKMQIQIDKLDARIVELLNKEQKERFAEFKKKTSKKKKSKKEDIKVEESEGETSAE